MEIDTLNFVTTWIEFVYTILKFLLSKYHNFVLANTMLQLAFIVTCWTLSELKLQSAIRHQPGIKIELSFSSMFWMKVLISWDIL